MQYIAIEVEPVEADTLRSASRRTFAIVGLAALTLFGVAIGVTRRELRRSAELADREREKRLASLGEMSAVLAHEIKNPLASLKGNAQLLGARRCPPARSRAHQPRRPRRSSSRVKRSFARERIASSTKRCGSRS